MQDQKENTVAEINRAIAQIKKIITELNEIAPNSLL